MVNNYLRVKSIKETPEGSIQTNYFIPKKYLSTIPEGEEFLEIDSEELNFFHQTTTTLKDVENTHVSILSQNKIVNCLETKVKLFQ
jgi:hypothetical protein